MPASLAPMTPSLVLGGATNWYFTDSGGGGGTFLYYLGGDGTPVFSSASGGTFATGGVRLMQYAPGYGSMNAGPSWDMGQVVSPMAGSDGFFTSFTAGTANPGTSGSSTAYFTGVCPNALQRQAQVSVGCALHLQAGSNSTQGWTSAATQGSSGVIRSTAQTCMFNAYFATPAACLGASACVSAADAAGSTWGLCFPVGAVTQVPSSASCVPYAGAGGMAAKACSQVNLFGFLKQLTPLSYTIQGGNNGRSGTLNVTCNAAATSLTSVVTSSTVVLTYSIAAGSLCPPASIASPAFTEFLTTPGSSPALGNSYFSLVVPGGAPSQGGQTVAMTLPTGPVVTGSANIAQTLTFDAATNTYYGFDGTYFVSQFGYARTTLALVCSPNPTLSILTATEAPQFTYNFVLAGAAGCGGFASCPAGTYQSGGTGNASCAPCTGSPAPNQYFATVCAGGSLTMAATLATCVSACAPGYTLTLPCVTGSVSVPGSPGVCTLATFGPAAWYDPGTLVPNGPTSPTGSAALWQPDGVAPAAAWVNRITGQVATSTGTLTLATESPSTPYSAAPVGGLGSNGGMVFVQGSNTATVTFPETFSSNFSVCTVSRYWLPCTTGNCNGQCGGNVCRLFAGTSNSLHGPSPQPLRHENSSQTHRITPPPQPSLREQGTLVRQWVCLTSGTG